MGAVHTRERAQHGNIVCVLSYLLRREDPTEFSTKLDDHRTIPISLGSASDSARVAGLS